MEATIFDMDGVLVDSERHWQHHLEEALLPALTDADIRARDVKGRNMHDIYEYVTARETPKLPEAAFLRRYRRLAERIYTEQAQLMPGCHDLLATLRDEDVATAVASSSPLAWIRLVTERFQLTDSVTTVVSAEDADLRGKPAPDIYRYTAEQLDADPAACVAVEDSAVGIRAAHGAGMYCIGYNVSGSDGEELEEADDVARTSAALETKLLELL